MSNAPRLVQGQGGLVSVSPRAVLRTPADQIGAKVFKTWDMLSDGIGTKAQTFLRARADLFPRIQWTARRYQAPDPWNPDAAGPMRWTFGAAADKALQRYRVERRGHPSKDGRVDVVVDTVTGAIEYSGQPYRYDPAGETLKDAATFVGASLAGYFAVTGLAGLTAGAGAAPTVAAPSIAAPAVAAPSIAAPTLAGVAQAGTVPALDAVLTTLKAAAQRALGTVASAKLVQALAGSPASSSQAPRAAPVAYPPAQTGAVPQGVMIGAGALLVAALVL